MKLIKCACGCGAEFEEKDVHGRKRKYISGHNGRKYKDPTQYKREWNYRNRLSKRKYKENYQKNRKVKLIELKGGKCENCGLKYNGENGCVFQFHHIDPSKKQIRLNLNGMGIAWSKIISESKKCKLLCSNCHFIHHSSEY